MAQYCTSGSVLAGQSFVPNSITTTTLSVPMIEIVSGPTDCPVITEIGVTVATNVTNTGVAIGLGKPAVRGAGYQSVSNPQGYDPNSAPPALAVYSAWSTPPTSPTAWLRRAIYKGGASSAIALMPIVFRFPRGLKMATASSWGLFVQLTFTGFWYGAEYWVEFDE